MTATKSEVGEHITAAEAQANFLVPTGMAWSEDLQKPIPRGEAIELAKLDKLCFFGCKEFDDLKTAIQVYADGGGFTGFSKQPQSAD